MKPLASYFAFMSSFFSGFQSFFQTPLFMALGVSGNSQNSGITVQNFPMNLSINEDTRTAIDLSGVKWKNAGGNNVDVTIQLTASSGVLEALSTNKVTVSGSGSDNLSLTGKLSQIQSFLNNSKAIYYTGAHDNFGTDATEFTVSATARGLTSVVTTAFVDIIDVPDNQTGTPQDDLLIGDRGRNALIGLAGNDDLRGLDGVDTLLGGDGNDTINGGGGADSLNGGAGEDVLQYITSSAGVLVDLNANAAGLQRAAGGEAQGDIISGFEHVYGTNFADTIIGGSDANILFGYDGNDYIDGRAGDDVIRGGAGADTLIGGSGLDWLRYLGSKAGVTVDLTANALGIQKASGGDAQGDVISGFENVQGSDSGDTITGDSGANYIFGNGGNDTIMGGAGNDSIRGGTGADRLDGGDGVDQLQYIGSSAGVTVDLRADANGFQKASGGDATGDVISKFENVYASDHNDVLTGDAARNVLCGFGGNDTLNGGDAKDVLLGGAGADVFVFNTTLGASNVDRILDFQAGIDKIHLDNAVFAALTDGALGAGAFGVAAGGVASTAVERIIYDSTTGDLYYDSDGSGAAKAILFATLSSTPVIHDTDFFIL
jgi:Ca2+-binding RTX toxin-like protein